MSIPFQESNVNLQIYENLTPTMYQNMEKQEHSLYLVNGVGIYKGEKLIASTSGSIAFASLVGTSVPLTTYRKLFNADYAIVQYPLEGGMMGFFTLRTK